LGFFVMNNLRDSVRVAGALFLLAGGLVAGCSKAAVQPVHTSAFVAKVGNTLIAANEVQAEVLKHRAMGNEEALNLLVRRELLFQEAKSAGFDRSPEVQAAWRDFVINRFADGKCHEWEQKTNTQDEARIVYRDHLDQFTRAEKWRVALIFLKKPVKELSETQKSFATRMAEIRDEAISKNSDWDFANLAKRVSEDPSSRNIGGDFGWMSAAAMNRHFPEKISEQVATMHVAGEISPVMEAETGFYTLRLTDYRPAETASFGAVREQAFALARKESQEHWQDEFYEDLMKSHPVEVNREALEKVPSPTNLAEAKPPRLPAR
jgi:peptidyl-prolyl cis-trans isomerase C